MSSQRRHFAPPSAPFALRLVLLLGLGASPFAHASPQEFSSLLNYSSGAALSDPTRFGSFKATYSSPAQTRRRLFTNFAFSLAAEQTPSHRAGTVTVSTSGLLGPIEAHVGLLSGMRAEGKGYAGSEQGLATELKLTSDQRLKLSSRIDLRETSFGDYFGFRWKWQNALSYQLGSHHLILQNIRGPQPLPVDILPVTWDYDFRVRPWSRLVRLLGAGLAWEFPATTAARLSLMAGYYGGFPGAGLRFSSPRLGVIVGSWGMSPAEELPMRVWQGLIELRY